ncbi:MAG: ShlB/FhaC/HecB family hemolysin secretion/activation protein [Leptolyngbyaceae cyanobacterium bins.349]|nr:ShlB/FhaC/HecB family hemolysin secretion/activation protein [Leptolyngbyaceae cyanobacterium bins.349]
MNTLPLKVCTSTIYLLTLSTQSVFAQGLNQPLPPERDRRQPQPIRIVPDRDSGPPSIQPLPPPRIEQLPPPEELLPSAPVTPPAQPPTGDVPQTIRIRGFNVTGSTVFSQQQFNQVITKAIGEIPPEGKQISLNELFQARSAVTQLYVDKGYITSGAFIPPQKLDQGVVEIRVVEGRLEDIRVTGTEDLKPAYISSRLGLATQAPLNRDRLLEALQLLQLNPLIASISAELSAGSRPGTSLLEVRVTEAKSTSATFTVDNQRVPSVGSVRGQVSGLEQNLLGYGDAISLGFTKTQGSAALDFTYSIPVSPRNTTVSFSAGVSGSNVIERPFEVLDIESQSNYFEITGRHPLIQTPTQEIALGLTFGRRSSVTTLLGDIPFPSPGADVDGRTTASVVRFFQEFTQRSSQSVFAARSQFNFGVDVLNANNNEEPPDTNFFAWRLQTQWVRLLAPETLLLVRGDLQLADRPLLPIEQFGVGGVLTVRGYRQDLLLTDNGFFGSVEGRIPILRLPQQQALLQVTPFFDFGRGWNLGQTPDPDPGFLASLGFGLRLQIGNNFTARMDFGFPLVRVEGNKETLQEKGIYFSIVYTPF